MALKSSDSFFRFVTMGAASARRTIDVLTERGFEPYELERYSTSNKIWQTKIKRLRMPDLFCVRTGMRFEVRAKTKLEIKMSDSPSRPGREWDAGLRNEDVIVFLQCGWDGGEPVPSDRLQCFSVGQLRATVEMSKLGPPKSAGEGAERDRVWPTVVPKQSGVVEEIESRRIRTVLSTGRRQSYSLSRRVGTDSVELHAYLGAGDSFTGGEEIVAGLPASKMSLVPPDEEWDVEHDLVRDDLSRFAAVKAIGLRGDSSQVTKVLKIAKTDPEARVRLEATAALMRLEHEDSEGLLLEMFNVPAGDDLRMETVLIAGEVRNEAANSVLNSMLSSEFIEGQDELLSAILWGLGDRGCRDFDVLLPYLGHASDLVACHAAVALGRDLPSGIVDHLISLLETDDRTAATSAWVLARGGSTSIPRLVNMVKNQGVARNWGTAILGHMKRSDVVEHLDGCSDLLASLEPWWKTTGERNWLANEESREAIEFVSSQTL